MLPTQARVKALEIQLMLVNMGFNMNESNMLLVASRKLDTDIYILANFIYGTACLNSWTTQEWSVENICHEYEMTNREYA